MDIPTLVNNIAGFAFLLGFLGFIFLLSIGQVAQYLPARIRRKHWILEAAYNAAKNFGNSFGESLKSTKTTKRKKKRKR